MPGTINNDFEKLVIIMDELREKCPWDMKQTIKTLRQQTIEETFELVDAITNNNWENIKEELGDLLLHITFYAKIGTEQNQFTLQEVIDGICNKLIRRHPHIYGGLHVEDEDDVKQNWEQIKLKEASSNAQLYNFGKNTEGDNKSSVLSGVPKALPAMVKAMRIQEKVKHIGFEWSSKEDVWEKIEEEKNEVLQAVQSGDQQHIEEEIGDLFFSVINYARFLKIDAENALELCNKKFIKRFTKMEEQAQADGKNLGDMTLAEMDEIWNNIKKQENGI